MLYHRAMDVIKDLEKRESSRIIQVGHKCNPIYPYNRETEGVWRQQRKRPCDQEAGGWNDAPAARDANSHQKLIEAENRSSPRP